MPNTSPLLVILLSLLMYACTNAAKQSAKDVYVSETYLKDLWKHKKTTDCKFEDGKVRFVEVKGDTLSLFEMSFEETCIYVFKKNSPYYDLQEIANYATNKSSASKLIFNSDSTLELDFNRQHLKFQKVFSQGNSPETLSSLNRYVNKVLIAGNYVDQQGAALQFDELGHITKNTLNFHDLRYDHYDLEIDYTDFPTGKDDYIYLGEIELDENKKERYNNDRLFRFEIIEDGDRLLIYDTNNPYPEKDTLVFDLKKIK